MDFSKFLVCHSRDHAEINCSGFVFVAICLGLTPKLKKITQTMKNFPKKNNNKINQKRVTFRLHENNFVAKNFVDKFFQVKTTLMVLITTLAYYSFRTIVIAVQVLVVQHGVNNLRETPGPRPHTILLQSELVVVQ